MERPESLDDDYLLYVYRRSLFFVTGFNCGELTGNGYAWKV
jgi:hypothetical protein